MCIRDRPSPCEQATVRLRSVNPSSAAAATKAAASPPSGLNSSSRHQPVTDSRAASHSRGADVRAAWRTAGRGRRWARCSGALPVARLPTLTAWAAEPLEVRLSTEPNAGPFLLFAMLHGHLHPGYDWLLGSRLRAGGANSSSVHWAGTRRPSWQRPLSWDSPNAVAPWPARKGWVGC